MTCIFCAICAGEAPASVAWADERTMAILDVNQPNPYKVLVLPRLHAETVFDLDDALAAAVFRTTVRVARAIREASGCPGLNLVQSNGAAGQQDVFHFHLHLLPRFAGDGVLLRWPDDPADRATLDRYADRLRECLAKKTPANVCSGAGAPPGALGARGSDFDAPTRGRCVTGPLVGEGVELGPAVIAGVRAQMRRLRQRLCGALEGMSPEDLGRRPNAESNSVGNLVVHVCGNLRQRFGAGLRGEPDSRDRDAEFAATGPWSAAELVALVERAFGCVDAALSSLTAGRLGEPQRVRGTQTTVLRILLRATAHIAEHVGQVEYISRARVP